MRILLLAPQPFFQERGTPIAVRLLCETLLEAGHQVEILTLHEGEDPGLPGLVIHRIAAPWGVTGIKPGFSGKKLLCDLALARRAWRLTGQRRFDLAHAVEESAFVAWGLKRLRGLPYVYDMDSSLSGQMLDKMPALRPLHGLMAGLEGAALSGSQGVLAVCRALCRQAKAQAPGVPVARLEDISLIESEAAPQPAAEVAELAGLKLMYVGNLESYQGIDLLLEGFALAAAANPELTLAVIGGAQGDIARYRQMARDLGIAERAHFLGPRPSSQLGAYLAAADILVSPRSQGENTPMKIYSYLDSGRPILATRLPTHTQALDDQVAMLVEPNPQDLARGLLALAADSGLRQALARRGGLRARGRYSRAAFRRKLLAFYRAVERSLPSSASKA